ncbi:hypothetical protein BGZ46_006886 [Entomortierella lignicola]|nr:hypothetical protein BGZ46_006886 [Entomortierella lignicola]
MSLRLVSSARNLREQFKGNSSSNLMASSGSSIVTANSGKSLTTKGILRQVQMGLSPKIVMDTIRLILDDDASTELSALRQVDIHLVAHAMKWAIRYSEETLVTYADYQSLYLDQGNI